MATTAPQRCPARLQHLAPSASSTCATAKIRISRPRSTRCGHGGIAGGEQLQGKELSYNNLVDLDAAWQLVQEFEAPAAAIIKHTNPCGCAEQPTLAEAYRKALEADPVSAFGGVLAFNRELDEETASEVGKALHRSHRRAGFLTGSAGHPDARRRICGWCASAGGRDELVVKSICGGSSRKQPIVHRSILRKLQVKTERAPTRRRVEALLVRLESLQAREVERHRLRARRADGSASAPAR